jgi:hypothetical protein
MTWTEWCCTNDNAAQAIAEIQRNMNPQAVYWIEKNQVYYNQFCCPRDEEGNSSPLSDCSQVTTIYEQALEYCKTHSNVPNFLVPGFTPIPVFYIDANNGWCELGFHKECVNHFINK